MTSSTSLHPAPSSARLNGWKEIASYMGRGVRTVQRWEKDLGLPVRRITTGRGETVFALVAELEAWRAAAEKKDDLSSRPGEEDVQEALVNGAAGEGDAGRSARIGWSRSRQVAIGVAALLLVAALGFAWWLATRRPGQPAVARIEDQALRVYDARGSFLWEHRFGFQVVSIDPGKAAGAQAIPIIEDIDGDGSREVLLVVNAVNERSAEALICFEADGRLRFTHRVTRRVAFGDMPAIGPWRPYHVSVVPDGNGRKAIWLSSIDRDQFPNVVEKIGPRNELLGEFWHPGYINVMLPTTWGGRDVMLLGGVSNEYLGGAVAIVDRGNPTGTGPALQPKFTCRGCPPGQPIEYLVLPGGEVQSLVETYATVITLRRGDRGEFDIVTESALLLARLGKGSGVMTGQTHYLFGPDLRPLSAEHQPDYRVLHDEAFRRGILDHPFSPTEDAAVWPALRWNGRAFDELRPGG